MIKGAVRKLCSVAEAGGAYDDTGSKTVLPDRKSLPNRGLSIGWSTRSYWRPCRPKAGCQRRPKAEWWLPLMEKDRMSDYQAMVAELRAGRHPRRGHIWVTPKTSGNH